MQSFGRHYEELILRFQATESSLFFDNLAGRRAEPRGQGSMFNLLYSATGNFQCQSWFTSKKVNLYLFFIYHYIAKLKLNHVVLNTRRKWNEMKRFVMAGIEFLDSWWLRSVCWGERIQVWDEESSRWWGLKVSAITLHLRKLAIKNINSLKMKLYLDVA